jgi:hypothetical protein
MEKRGELLVLENFMNKLKGQCQRDTGKSVQCSPRQGLEFQEVRDWELISQLPFHRPNCRVMSFCLHDSITYSPLPPLLSLPHYLFLLFSLEASHLQYHTMVSSHGPSGMLGEGESYRHPPTAPS